MAVSITEIAGKLNISPSTVSRILNGKGNYSDDLRKKVLKTAKEMNYIPNGIARNLQQKSSQIIGVVVPDITDSFFANVIRGIDTVLTSIGYHIFLCNTNEDPVKEAHFVDLLYKNRVAGIIIATVRNNISPDNILHRGGIPVVFFDNLPGEGIRFNSVSTNNFEIGRLAGEYLISKGHTKIAAIMGKQNETTGYQRYKGFLNALTAHGLSCPPTLCKFCDFKEESGKNAMDELISGPDFTAVFIASSKMTYGAMMSLSQNRLSIPRDISIFAVDIVDKYNIIKPGITSVIQSEDEIGRAAAHMLMEKIRGVREYSNLLLEPFLIERESVKKM